MAVRKDERWTLSLSSFLITLSLAVFFGYLSIMGGFWSGMGNMFTTLYALLMAICGGFALSSYFHLIMASKSSQQKNCENASNGTPQKVAPPQTEEDNNLKANLVPQPIPNSKQFTQKPTARDPDAKVPSTQSIPVKSPVQAVQNANGEPQAVKLVGPVVKNNQQFLDTFIKLASIAKACQELVENEKELSKKEQVRLSLQRREFRQMYSTVKNSRFETF